LETYGGHSKFLSPCIMVISLFFSIFMIVFNID
jgi:hypothetical protein